MDGSSGNPLERTGNENRRAKSKKPGTRPGPGGNGKTPGTGTNPGTGPGTGTLPTDTTATADLIKEAPGVQVETVQVPPFEAPPLAGEKPILTGKEVINFAVILMTLVDSLAVAGFGPDAAMKVYEKSIIQPPLERIIEKYNVANNALVVKYMDPVLLALGLIAWTSRISKLETAKKPAKEKEDKPAPAAFPSLVPAPPPAPTGPATSDIGTLTAAPAEILNAIRTEGL